MSDRGDEAHRERLLDDLDGVIRRAKMHLAESEARGEYDGPAADLMLRALELEAKVAGLDAAPEPPEPTERN